MLLSVLYVFIQAHTIRIIVFTTIFVCCDDDDGDDGDANHDDLFALVNVYTYQCTCEKSVYSI